MPENVQADVDTYGRAGTANPWKTRDNFQERLKNLLHVEEAENRKFLRRYDMYNSRLTRLESYQKGKDTIYAVEDEPIFRLRVPGLAEKKPSVLYNDSVFVWIPDTKDVEYEGRVTQVETDAVLCIFNPLFIKAHDSSVFFNVRFSGHRLQFRLMHRAIEVVNMDVIYPPAPSIASILAEGANYLKKIDIQTLELSDKQLYNNAEQLQVLEAALNRHYHPVYVKSEFRTLSIFSNASFLQQDSPLGVRRVWLRKDENSG